MTAKKIAVLGAGANGASVGADLTRAGLDVTLIEQWPAHVEAMRARRDPDRDAGRDAAGAGARLPPLRGRDASREPFDIVLLLMKAYDTRWACELIKPLPGRTGSSWACRTG